MTNQLKEKCSNRHLNFIGKIQAAMKVVVFIHTSTKHEKKFYLTYLFSTIEKLVIFEIDNKNLFQHG